ncbi:MAG: PQQ-binding-like beta-propeller repeat protein [Pirellulales bacterium]
MSAERLIELIEEQRVLPDRLVEKLRAKLTESDQSMTASALAKFLVQKKHLTSRQASDLLAALPVETSVDAPANRTSQTPPSSAGPAPPAKNEDDEPGNSSIFAPLLFGSKGANADDEDVFTLTPIEGEDDPEQAQALAEELSRQKLEPIDDFGHLSASKLSSPDLPKQLDDALVQDVYLPAGSGSLRAAPSSVIRKRTEAKVKKEVARRAAARTGVTAPTLRKKVKRSNQWDSPLLLVGGGVLVLMILCGGIVALILNRRGGDEKLAEARKYRDAGSFAQAIASYEEFAAGYPGDVLWSNARAELAMAKLRQAVEGGGSFQPALAIAQAELQALENDRNFDQQKLSDARPELAELLPRIASGLADQADASDDPAEAERLTKAAAESLILCRNAKYVSKELRDDVALADVEEKLARVGRRQQTRGDLDSGLTTIKTAIAAGDTRAAYAAHKQLLDDHPELATNDQLKAIIVETSVAEKAGVKFVVDEHAAETTERPTPWLAALATGNRQAIATAPANGTFCARIDGALYAFDVATGKMLWRRYVGFAGGLPPVTVGDHVLAFDAKYQELLCLEARTGKLVWRQEFGEPIATPLAVADRAFVATESGRLFLVDLSSGARMGYLQFAQPLRVTPIVDRTGERLYLTGDHSSIYTISLADLTCQGVYYLGHSSGSIRVPPSQVLDRLAVLENDGVSTCRLRILSFDDRGAVAKVETERRLKGLAASPPLVTSRRLIVITDRGELDAFDVGSAEGEKTLTQVATREPTSREPLVRHALMTQGAIWIGDTQLTKYAVVPTGNRLPVQSIDDSFVHSTFDHPLALFGTVLVHVRRLDGKAGVVVAAIDADSGRALWTNELAVPPAATPIVDEANRTLAFADVNGLVYRFDDAALRSQVQDQPFSPGPATSDSSKLTVGVDLGAGRAAFAAPGESSQLVLYDPAVARNPTRRTKLPSTIICAMSPFGKGVLVPLEIGQVFYLNPADGLPLATPFQPRLQPRMKVPYQPAAQADEAGRQFVITDGHEKIYLVELVEQPQPHFTTVTDGNVGAFPIVSPIFVMGQTALAITDGGQLTRFDLPSLKNAGQTDLPSDVVWGPYRVGDLLLVVTANDQLVAVRADGSIAWADAVQGGDLAGEPLATDGGFLLAYRKGILERRGLADGQPTGKLDVEHPLAAGPVRFMDHIVLTAHDGTLLVVEQP